MKLLFENLTSLYTIPLYLAIGLYITFFVTPIGKGNARKARMLWEPMLYTISPFLSVIETGGNSEIAYLPYFYSFIISTLTLFIIFIINLFDKRIPLSTRAYEGLIILSIFWAVSFFSLYFGAIFYIDKTLLKL